VAAVDVGVEEAEPVAADPERGDDAAALPARLDAFGAVAKARLAGSARLLEPGRDRREQRRGRLAARQSVRDRREGAGTVFAREQHAARAAQRGGLGDQPVAERRLRGRAG
jgi:hypothetical protein